MGKRFANADWNLDDGKGNVGSWEKVAIAVMMDVRDELQKLNLLLHCPNFVAIPRKLDAIHKKMPARRKRKL